MNLASALEGHASRQPDRQALRHEGRTWTYREVGETVNRLATALMSLGVQRGDRIAIMLPNWPEFHFCTHAAWKLGAVEVPVNIMYRDEEASYLLANSQTRLIFASGEAAQVVQRIRRALPDLAHVVVVGEGGGDETIRFDEVVRRGSPEFPAADVHPDDLAIIAYTSGTTGFPKGSMLSHENLIVSIEAWGDYLGLTDEDDILQALPCFHSNASLIGNVFGWFLGSSVTLLQRARAVDLALAVTAERPAFFACVPTLLYDIMHLPSDVPADFGSVRYVSFGAAPTPPHVRSAVEQRFGLRLVQAYGMTEAPNVLTADPIDGPVQYQAAGKALPHLAVTVVGPDGQPLPTGEVGEICVGPGRDPGSGRTYRPMAGYWRNPEATAEALRDGVFHTGDVGRLDEDGFLYVIDRKRDLIIRGGNNIFPAELERVLLSDPRVDEAYVVGVPDERLGEVPKAFIVLKPGARADAAELKDLVEGQLASYKRLEYVEFADPDSFPRTALGKVLKRELAARARASSEGPAPSAETPVGSGKSER